MISSVTAFAVVACCCFLLAAKAHESAYSTISCNISNATNLTDSDSARELKFYFSNETDVVGVKLGVFC
jgi:hypothetical protein